MDTALKQSLKEAITQERLRREACSEADLLNLVHGGAGQEALENLVFFASPPSFLSFVESLEQRLVVDFWTFEEQIQEHHLRFVVDLALALHSILPRWNLQNPHRHGGAALQHAQIEELADQVQALAEELAAQGPAVVDGLLAELRVKAFARLEAEESSDPRAEAEALVGRSIGQYLTNTSAALAQSHLRRIAEMQLTGQTLTEISNDYAAFLQYALYLGASFATTNPPLLDLAWLADPDHWNAVVDAIIAQAPGADDAELGRLATLEIVLANMRLLRPIFLLTEGRMGCVCLQVNPHNHGDAQQMVDDALFFYGALRERLDGGVPNVVFKLPGTKAGLEACRALTRRGIGVTITVSFGMFQHIPFGEAIAEGKAIFSCLVEMNGRLAFPVRDELLAKLDELARHGIDETKAREAAAWAGVAVVKRLYALLAERGYDLRRFKTLVASLRIYHSDGYEDLPSAYPDITETLGTSILSVFPNVRHRFDRKPEAILDPMRIMDQVPDDVLAVLSHSEIFKQAYYVANRDWVPNENDALRPDYELTLDDEERVAAWIPVRDTLGGFQNSYDAFVARVLERKRLLMKA